MTYINKTVEFVVAKTFYTIHTVPTGKKFVLTSFCCTTIRYGTDPSVGPAMYIRRGTDMDTTVVLSDLKVRGLVFTAGTQIQVAGQSGQDNTNSYERFGTICGVEEDA